MSHAKKELLTVAAVQLTSTHNVEANLERACHWVRQGAAAGADLVALPECFAFVGGGEEMRALAQTVESGAFLAPLKQLAAQLGVAILAGTIPECGPNPEHVFNTTVLLGRDGRPCATYRKIHLFDASSATHALGRESAYTAAGSTPVVAPFEGWQLGLAVCYDLRFPELFRLLVERGADILCLPSAFTLHTGKDHWEVLLRARAIENQCYVVAPAQIGRHDAQRTSWGKSMLLDPWGTPLAIAPEREGCIVSVFSATAQQQLRRSMACLQHRRL